MRKVLSFFMAIVMLMSMFAVNSYAIDDVFDEELEEEYVMTLDDVITSFEDAVFITMTGGEITDNIKRNVYEDGVLTEETVDEFNVYSNKNGEYDENGNKPLYTEMSIVHKIENEGYEIKEYYLDTSDDYGNVTFVFYLTKSGETVWYRVTTTYFGYIFDYVKNTEKTQDGVLVRCEESHEFTYNENTIYVKDCSRSLVYGEYDFIELIASPGAEYYVTVTGENPEAVYVFDFGEFIEIIGSREGTAEINIVDCDTDEIIKTVYVTVEFTTWNWFCYIVLFGWIWM